MMNRGGRFRRANRLRKSREFRRVSTEGSRVAGSHVILLGVAALPGSSGSTGVVRLGVTVSRKVGRAVVRNRVKRRLREWFRRAKNRLPEGLELVVIARASAASADLTMLSSELDRLTHRLCGSA